VLIEGVMSVFTGLLNEKVPYSAAEIAMSSNIPMILATGVNKGGIESAAIDIVAHANMLEKFGVSVEAVLLNKVYNEDIFDNVVPYIRNNTNVEKVLKIPKLKNADMRGFIPEVEIRYELFTSYAMDLVENSLNMDDIIGMAREVEFNKIYSFDEIKSRVI
jgi:cobyrinic acid a,c-diamide synthase